MNITCDIILLSYESPGLLKKCVQSVLDHTQIPSRLIIVDNASRDEEVRTYLNGLSGTDNVIVEKIFGAENVGFARGMNKGMSISDAPYVCLLNNDCIVTPFWLDEMISVAESRADIGIVNPQSNTFGSYPDKSATLNEHASLLGDRKGKYVELGHAIGFACLIKREVIDKVGSLDAIYEGVCYEDTDFSMKAMKAGYIPVMAEASYVYHKEQASRKNLKGKDEIYRRNRAIFEKRWGRLLRLFFLEPGMSGKERLMPDYRALRNITRQRAIIDVWVREGNVSCDEEVPFYNEDVVRHADISVKTISAPFAEVMALWKILTKKKRYDAVIVEDGFLPRMLSLFAFTRRSKIFILGPGMKVRSSKGEIFDLREAASLAKYLRRR